MPVRLALTATMAAVAIALTLAPPTGLAADPGRGTCPEPASVAAIRSVPEARRAECFGDRPITFRAWGWDLANVWPGVQLPGAFERDFVLAVTPQGRGLAAFLPPSVTLPDPTGTPWEQQDGIAPGDAWWRVTGHFDDPRAVLCLPAVGDDGSAELSQREAREFCRNHFVIDRLVWFPEGPPETATGPTAGAPRTSPLGEPAGIVLAVGLATLLVALRRWPARGPRRHPW